MTDRDVDEIFAPWCRSLTAESSAGVGWHSGLRPHGMYLAARHPPSVPLLQASRLC
jgi:hypothetical protein